MNFTLFSFSMVIALLVILGGIEFGKMLLEEFSHSSRIERVSIVLGLIVAAPLLLLWLLILGSISFVSYFDIDKNEIV